MSDSYEQKAELFSIKEVAEKTGLPASTIRYYDQQFGDYLDVKRGAGRRRMFSPQAVGRLQSLQHMLKQQGLSLRQVREKLSGTGPASVGSGSAELDQCRAEIKRLAAQVASLEKQVAELRDIQRRTLSLVGGLTGG